MINYLPEEIIAEILSFVDFKEIVTRISLICKSWRGIAHQYCKNATLRFYCSEEANVDDLIKVVCSSFWSDCIDYMMLNSCHLTDEHVELICKAVDNGHFKNLKYLSLVNNPIHISSLIAINQSFSKTVLEAVYFEDCSITEEDIEKFLENESHQNSLWFISIAFFSRFYSQINDEEKVYEYYERAANLGDKYACYELSYKYQHSNPQQELFWLTKGHEMGEHMATNRLADKYYENAEYESAFTYYSNAAEKGNGNAMLKIGIMYENGQFVERNYVESKKWIYRAVNVYEHLSPDLALRYLNGSGGFEKDLRRAILYFERSLVLSSESTYYMALMYLEGNEFVEKNVSKVVDMLESIKYSKREASLLLGKIYSTGLEGIKRNPYKAASLLSLENDLSVKEQVELGKIYLEIGGRCSAEKWLLKAEEEGGGGDVEVLLLLAEIYETRTNQQRAYYLKAADQGSIEAQYKLGLYYAKSDEKDTTKAIKYLTKAANSGHEQAQYELSKYEGILQVEEEEDEQDEFNFW